MTTKTNNTESNATAIATAVEPQRAAAIEAVREAATAHIEKIALRLKEVNGDVGAIAPRPTTNTHNKPGTVVCWDRSRWNQLQRNHDALMGLTAQTAETVEFNKTAVYGSTIPFEQGREISAPKAAHYIKQAMEAADADYTAFVAKLEAKVGEHVDAKLTGDHVWAHSVLTITKADGSVERWKTQRILNVSSLGLVFNQWPTRKQK